MPSNQDGAAIQQLDISDQALAALASILAPVDLKRLACLKDQ